MTQTSHDTIKTLCNWLRRRVCSLGRLCQCFPPNQELDARRGGKQRTTARDGNKLSVSVCRLLPMSITSVIQRTFLCENRHVSSPVRELCKAADTCDYRLKALINPLHHFTHTGFGCSYSCIDFLFLFYFKSQFLEAQAKNNTLFTQILASAKWEATAELVAKCFNLDLQTHIKKAKSRTALLAKPWKVLHTSPPSQAAAELFAIKLR